MQSAVRALRSDNCDTAPGLSQVGRRSKAAQYTLDQCRSLVCRTFAMAIGAAGMKVRSVAEAARCNRNLVGRWMDPDSPGSVPLHRLLVMADTSVRGRDVALSVLTAALMYIQRSPEPPQPDRTLQDMMLDMHAEVGDVARVWRDAIADGVIDASEAKAMIKELREAEMLLAQIRHATAKIIHGEK